jgi:hypothetical protein
LSSYPELVGPRLDRVYTYEDQVSFLIPHEWEEIDDADDHYCYEEPGDEGGIGWLRVSLICTKGDGCAQRETHRLKQDGNAEGRQFWAKGENLVQHWREFSEREGDPLCNHYWSVTRAFPPNEVKKVVFTYTVPSQRIHEIRTQQIISLLSEKLSESAFSLTPTA